MLSPSTGLLLLAIVWYSFFSLCFDEAVGRHGGGGPGAGGGGGGGGGNRGHSIDISLAPSGLNLRQ